MIFETKRLKIEKLNLIDEAQLDDLLLYHRCYHTMIWIPNTPLSWDKDSLQRKFSTSHKHDEDGTGIYALLYKKHKKIIGEFGLFPNSECPDIPEIGYIIHQPYWNKGLGTKLLSAAIAHYSQRQHFSGLMARMYHHNTAFVALCQKLNFELRERLTLDKRLVRLTYIYKFL